MTQIMLLLLTNQSALCQGSIIMLKVFYDINVNFKYDLGNAVVSSLAQSMKKLADAIHNCRSRPIIKASVMLNDDKVRRDKKLNLFHIQFDFILVLRNAPY